MSSLPPTERLQSADLPVCIHEKKKTYSQFLFEGHSCLKKFFVSTREEQTEPYSYSLMLCLFELFILKVQHIFQYSLLHNMSMPYSNRLTVAASGIYQLCIRDQVGSIIKSHYTYFFLSISTKSSHNASCKKTIYLHYYIQPDYPAKVCNNCE